MQPYKEGVGLRRVGSSGPPAAGARSPLRRTHPGRKEGRKKEGIRKEGRKEGRTGKERKRNPARQPAPPGQFVEWGRGVIGALLPCCVFWTCVRSWFFAWVVPCRVGVSVSCRLVFLRLCCRLVVACLSLVSAWPRPPSETAGRAVLPGLAVPPLCLPSPPSRQSKRVRSSKNLETPSATTTRPGSSRTAAGPGWSDFVTLY